MNIEKRHVIGHNLGLSDERYAEATTTTLPGQTVVLLADEVRRFAALAMRVVDTVESQAFPSAALDAEDAGAMPGNGDSRGRRAARST